jgi:hypothetical protein
MPIAKRNETQWKNSVASEISRVLPPSRKKFSQGPRPIKKPATMAGWLSVGRYYFVPYRPFEKFFSAIKPQAADMVVFV